MQHPSPHEQTSVALAEAIREACVQAALDAYENARMDGLCHDGAWEVAIGAIQRLNVARLVQEEQREYRSSS